MTKRKSPKTRKKRRCDNEEVVMIVMRKGRISPPLLLCHVRCYPVRYPRLKPVGLQVGCPTNDWHSDDACRSSPCGRKRVSSWAAFFKPFSPCGVPSAASCVAYCTIFSCLLSIALVAIPPKAKALGFPRAVVMRLMGADDVVCLLVFVLCTEVFLCWVHRYLQLLCLPLALIP